MTAQQKKILFLHHLANDNLLCSGVMVDSTWLLTAAHCVADENGYFDTDEYDVCTRENLQSGAQCFGIADARTPGGTWDGDVEDDYAVVKLDGAPGEGWMAITSASDSTTSSYTNFHRAYPGWVPGCIDNFEYSLSEVIVEGPPGVRMYKADGDIQSTPSGRVRFDISSAVGMSGGPFFYCPNGPCDDGHWVTSIMSTPNIWWFFGWTGYMEGPKGSDFRTWVINNTP